MRVAYLTSFSCGTGHAVRGRALEQAGRRHGIEVRAFGPTELGRAPGFRPDLVLGDIAWWNVDAIRRLCKVPGWLLLRWVDPKWRVPVADGWEKVIATEPAAREMPGITDQCAPIVLDAPGFTFVDGQELVAGYNTYWEVALYGNRDRVTWITDTPEREVRVRVGGKVYENGADALMRMADA